MKETMEKRYSRAVKNNPKLIQRVIDYLTLSFNITIDDLKANTYRYVKDMLEKLKTSNKKLLMIRENRKTIEEDLQSLERAYVVADCLEPREVSTTNHENNVEKRQLLKIELREQIFNSIVESNLMEKSLNDNNKLIIEFIGIMPRLTSIEVLEMAYIKGMSNSQIANTLFYSDEYVKKARLRGVEDLSGIIKLYLSVPICP